jgi:Tol biopolymer transport system component
LAYVAGSASTARLVRVTRRGRATALDRDARRYDEVALSPDGTRAALAITAPGGRGIWLFDLARHDITRLTTSGDADYPIWSRDGRRVAYARHVGGSYDILARNADGSGPIDTLVSGAPYQFPGGWSHDGSWLLYRQNDTETAEDIYTARLADHATHPFATSRFTEIDPVLSPDDRWVAFVSDETGRREVYVQAVSGGGKIPVSIGGGDEPRWASDGRELYYRGTDSLYAVAFHGSVPPVLGKPVALFRDRFAHDTRFPRYDVLPGTAGFVMLQPADNAPVELRVVLHWTTILATASRP